MPELDEVFQVAEQPDEAGHDEGMQRVWHPGAGVLFRSGDAHTGELVGQRGVNY